MTTIVTFKPLGEILQDAGLITASQIQVALYDQQCYQDLRVGEILAMRGWIKQATADFFGEQWFNLVNQKQQHPLGYYLKQAGLLTEEDIQSILREQKKKSFTFWYYGGRKWFVKTANNGVFSKKLISLSSYTFYF